ncbi:MAG: bifunctional hydroxymethylpyrimidine kinase/phosphomethylpyrimidine kinase [Verrucomicrobiae bacterium]
MMRPVVLSIAGSDNSCGAGAQADLKTITALGGYAQTAITCVVAEVPGKVSAIQAVSPQIVAEQIRLSFEAFPIAAIKTGMLYSAAIIRAVSGELARHRNLPPMVVDPVMVASSGAPLLKRPAISAYKTLLFPRAALVTPNLDELRVLSGMPCRTLAEMMAAGRCLVEEFGVPFLLKGGHLKTRFAVDILATACGAIEFHAPFVRGADTHGTGCTFSSAIAVGLAAGLPLPDAVGQAKAFITEAIATRFRWKKTTALNHAGRPAQ